MRAISRRLVKLENAARVLTAPKLRHRIEFIAPGEKPGTGGTMVGFILNGDGWTDEERAAAVEENAALRGLYGD